MIRNSGIVSLKKKKRKVSLAKLINESHADFVQTNNSSLKEFLKRNNL